MKTTLSVIFLMLLCLSVSAKINVGFSADAGSVQDFLIKNSSCNFGSDLRCAVNKNFEVRIPVGLVRKNGASMIDIGASLDYYPFEDLGIFVGLSLIQFGFVSPESLLSKSTVSLNEVTLGWTLCLKNGFFIEPCLLIRDPSGTFSDEYSLLKGAFPCYTTFRAKLMCGYKFNIGGN